ncbi:MAG: hypothetical protein JNM86_13915 [Phycisphaerae bacterium]|nr:hypothetical protein [Phycisphaerae bacterium]
MTPQTTILAPALALLLLASAGFAQEASVPRMTILDRNLQRITGDLERLNQSTIQYIDTAGRSKSIERSRVLAIYSARGHSASIPSAIAAGEGGNGIPGILRLTDGQIVPGFLVPTDNPGESVSWRSRRIGPFLVPLDRTSSILLTESIHEIANPQRDSAILGNSDRVEGFVEGIGTQLTIESGGKKDSFPIERVGWIGLANQPSPGSLPLVFLSDGSVLATTELASAVPAGKAPSDRTATALWALASESGTGVIDLDSIDAILFDPRSIVPLAAISPARVSGIDGRRWTPTPDVSRAGGSPIGLASITISGPVQVEWKLPAGSAKFGASISLPPQAAPWGNSAVVISAAGANGTFKEVAKADLSAEKPGSEIVADITDAQTLRIEVRGKTYSDVQAQIVLHQPLVLRKAETTKRP